MSGFYRPNWRSAWLGAASMLCLLSPIGALAQSEDLAPYLHQKPHPVVAPKAKGKPRPKLPPKPAKPKAVPVITPHHPGPPRHAVASGKRHAAPPKPVVANPPPPPKQPAPPPGPPNIGTNTGLPLPRYAALKSDDVNMRSGPAERYPAIWTYHRRDLPVKIEREFDIWRQVEDMDGIKGWMQAGFLTGRRSFVTIGTEDRILRAQPDDTAEAVADLKPGVVGRIKACEAGKDWCEMQVQDYRGWLKRSDVWGVDADEAVAP